MTTFGSELFSLNTLPPLALSLSTSFRIVLSKHRTECDPFALSLSKGKRRPFILRQAQDERTQDERSKGERFVLHEREKASTSSARTAREENG
jgi:hypothetical protein